MKLEISDIIEEHCLVLEADARYSWQEVCDYMEKRLGSQFTLNSSYYGIRTWYLEPDNEEIMAICRLMFPWKTP